MCPFVVAARVWDPERGYDNQAAEATIGKARSILKELGELC